MFKVIYANSNNSKVRTSECLYAKFTGTAGGSILLYNGRVSKEVSLWTLRNEEGYDKIYIYNNDFLVDSRFLFPHGSMLQRGAAYDRA